MCLAGSLRWEFPGTFSSNIWGYPGTYPSMHSWGTRVPTQVYSPWVRGYLPEYVCGYPGTYPSMTGVNWVPTRVCMGKPGYLPEYISGYLPEYEWGYSGTYSSISGGTRKPVRVQPQQPGLEPRVPQSIYSSCTLITCFGFCEVIGHLVFWKTCFPARVLLGDVGQRPPPDTHTHTPHSLLSFPKRCSGCLVAIKQRRGPDL